MRLCATLLLWTACATPQAPPTPPGPGAEARFVAELLEGVHSCRHEFMATLSPGQLAALTGVPASFTHACDPVIGHYDRWVADLAGVSRSGDEALADAARIREDGEYLRRSLEDPAGQWRTSAWEHLDDALRTSRERLGTHRVVPWPAMADAGDASWRRSVGNDRFGPGAVVDRVGRYLLIQGEVAGYRWRFADALNRPGRRTIDLRQAMVSAMEDGPERDARQTYLAATDALMTTGESTVAAYRGGKVAADTRARLTTAVQQADAAWRDAWRTEHARLGIELPPERSQEAPGETSTGRTTPEGPTESSEQPLVAP